MHGPPAGRGLQGAAPLASRHPLFHYRPLHCSYSFRPDSPEFTPWRDLNLVPDAPILSFPTRRS